MNVEVLNHVRNKFETEMTGSYNLCTSELVVVEAGAPSDLSVIATPNDRPFIVVGLHDFNKATILSACSS